LKIDTAVWILLKDISERDDDTVEARLLRFQRFCEERWRALHQKAKAERCLLLARQHYSIPKSRFADPRQQAYSDAEDCSFAAINLAREIAKRSIEHREPSPQERTARVERRQLILINLLRTGFYIGAFSLTFVFARGWGPEACILLSWLAVVICFRLDSEIKPVAELLSERVAEREKQMQDAFYKIENERREEEGWKAEAAASNQEEALQGEVLRKLFPEVFREQQKDIPSLRSIKAQG